MAAEALPSAASMRPLDGVLVVSIEQALAAPICTSRLVQMGARVIKVERAEGDFARGYDRVANGESSYFVWTNHGKESLVLDFKRPEDAALLEQLLSRADVFVQNLAPGALTRAGFDSEALRQRHPRLVTCDISGYGLDGPASGLKAYDLLVQCESGLAGISGSPEACGRVGVSICDIGAGLNATIGVLSALAQRQRSGVGSGVSVSLFDAAADWMTVPYLHEVHGAGAPTRQGLRHPSIAPYGAFVTAEGRQVVIGIQNEREWRSFCAVFLQQPALADDVRFIGNDARVRNRAALDALVGEVFGRLGIAEVLTRLVDAGTAHGQVRSVAELATHPALRTWPMQVGDVEIQVIAPPVRTAWDTPRFGPIPSIGQHGAALRREFSPLTQETTHE
ncbi:CaiB/BaiF CoA transferase family protein [Leptothrix sp. BB-4]